MRISKKSKAISITLPHSLVEKINKVAADTGTSRSELIKDILNRIIYDNKLLDEIYPFEEEIIEE